MIGRQTILNPQILGRVLNRQYYQRINKKGYYSKGIDIFDADWDTLIVLDGCRYDLFADKVSLPGKLEKRSSRGSATNEWLFANFGNRKLQDIVYVVANPMLHRNRNQFNLNVYAVIDVWESGWDEDLGTVPPDAVAKAAMQAHLDYPNKRIVSHFIQPHYPFISDGAIINAQDGNGQNVWNDLARGESEFSEEEVIKSYKSNIEPVMNAVQPMISSIEGRIVVTSDHGNMLGERSFPIPTRDWGHPPGIYTKELVHVPWHIIDQGERRSVYSEASEEIEPAKQNVDDKLSHLGYL